MFHNLVTAILFQMRMISTLELAGHPINGDVQTSKDRLDTGYRAGILASFSLHARDQKFDYEVIDRSNSAIVNAETQRHDYVAGVLSGIVDRFQTIKTRLRKPIKPAVETIGDEYFIWNHIKRSG